MVKKLLGNATTKINVNKNLIVFFKRAQENREGCLPTPLEYAIVVDGLTWPIYNRAEKGELKGI